MVRSITILIIFFLLVIYGIFLSMKFEDIGDIIIDDQHLKIFEGEKITEFKIEEISRIVFLFGTPEDQRYQKIPIMLSGFQNKIIIVTNTKIEHYIFCTYATYSRIRTFKSEHQYKIRIFHTLIV